MNEGARSGGVRPMTVAVALALIALASSIATRRFAFSEAAAAVREERLTVASPSLPVPPLPPPLADGPVKNVLLLIGDGMGGTQVALGRIQTRGPDGRLRLERLPVTGRVMTHAVGALVTKSDAAATALASGFKTTNGRIGEDPAGRSLPTLLEALRDRGYATGLVTTSRITDATPACFAAHVDERNLQNEIAEQLAASRVDLLFGGGRRFFEPQSARGSARKDDRNLLAEMSSRGVHVVGDAAGLAAAEALPLAAIFAVEPQAVPERVPSVGAMATKAIELLAASGRPFFALIEEEEIDTAGHANDARRVAGALERFDQAVGAAVDFAARDGHTLVLVTGDHSTGGPVIDNHSTSERLVVVWESDGHSGEPVPIYAYGPPSAAARFEGVMDNTEIPRRVAAVLGFDFPSAATAGAAK